MMISVTNLQQELTEVNLLELTLIKFSSTTTGIQVKAIILSHKNKIKVFHMYMHIKQKQWWNKFYNIN